MKPGAACSCRSGRAVSDGGPVVIVHVGLPARDLNDTRTLRSTPACRPRSRPPGPRPGRAVHSIVRHGLGGRGDRGGQDPAMSAGELLRRTVRADCPDRTYRPYTDLRRGASVPEPTSDGDALEMAIITAAITVLGGAIVLTALWCVVRRITLSYNCAAWNGNGARSPRSGAAKAPAAEGAARPQRPSPWISGPEVRAGDQG